MTPDWQDTDAFYNTYGAALRARFGGRVQRVSIDAGFTCPNVDGTLARGGCVFCDNRSFSPSRRVRLKKVLEQLDSGIKTVRERYGKVSGFIAYFQPATNTYAPVDQLEELYKAAVEHEAVVGLAIGTRPDCVPNEVLDLIDSLAADRYVSLEYGMQSIHQASLDWMNRAHDHAAMVDAMNRSRGRKFETCAHIILGIPGETHEHMMQTATEVARLRPDAIKLHNLYAVHGTPLGEQVLAGEVSMLEKDDYIRIVVDFLERMPPEMIIERVSGEAPGDFLIAPKWCQEKSSIRIEIDNEFRRRGTRQGTHFDRLQSSTNKFTDDPAYNQTGDNTCDPLLPDRTPAAVQAKLQANRKLPVLKMMNSKDSSDGQETFTTRT